MCTERELAAQTLADFKRDGLGHHLDNADADVLREMVRLSVERHWEALVLLRAARGEAMTHELHGRIVEFLDRIGVA